MTEYEFEKESLESKGLTCPNCNVADTYMFKGGQHVEYAQFSRKCNKCGEVYSVVYLPHHIEKLRKEF